MTKFWWAFLLAGFVLPVSARCDWGLPNPPSTAIGESGTFYLTNTGLFFDVHNNDWIGQTDKLVTYSSALAWYQALQTKDNPEDTTPEALKLALNSRLLTPIIKTRFDAKELNPHVGIFAEWLELQLAYSHMLGRFKVELSFAGDFFGNFHTDDVYRYLHEAVGSPNDWDQFGKRYEGTFGAVSLGFGYAWNDWLMSMAYYDKSQIMEDYTLTTNFIHRASADLELAAEARFVTQLSSEVYVHPRPYRYEWGWGMRWYFWQIHFKYVSPYLEEDRYGQYYISPLIFNWHF